MPCLYSPMSHIGGVYMPVLSYIIYIIVNISTNTCIDGKFKQIVNKAIINPVLLMRDLMN